MVRPKQLIKLAKMGSCVLHLVPTVLSPLRSLSVGKICVSSELKYLKKTSKVPEVVGEVEEGK